MYPVKVCRVCLSECTELTPLWVQLPGENKTLKEAINFVANINIKLEDGLPDKICKTCESLLDLADTFKQRCLESESILEKKVHEKHSDEFRSKHEKYHQENSQISSENTSCLPTSVPYTAPDDLLGEKTEKSANINYDFPETKIKIEIVNDDYDSMTNEQDNLDTAEPEYEVPIENCFIKQEFSAETMKYFENAETFSCPHCSETFPTKLSCKLHIFFTHSSFIHRKGVSTAEIKSATEDPTAADTSTIMKEISKYRVKKESTTDASTSLDNWDGHKLSGTKTEDNWETEKQSELFSNTVIGTTGNIPTCDICGYTTTTVKNLNSHLIAHAATKRYSCDSCLYLTVKLDHFNNHIRTHTSDKPYSCDVCQKKLISKSDLLKHVKTHTDEKPYECRVCKKQFAQNYYLVKHMRTHTGEKPYACDICDKRFNRKHRLAHHLKGIHAKAKHYFCNVCNKQFSEKHNLVKHLRVHTGERPHACNICDNKYSERSHLVMHMRKHTGEKPYSCDMCEKQFDMKRKLVEHSRTHTGEKPYTCKVCQKTFSNSSNLVKHRRIHTDLRPHSCTLCEKQFSLKSYLRRHMRTHSGARPYTCEVCDKQFTQKSNLVKHMRKHTD